MFEGTYLPVRGLVELTPVRNDRREVMMAMAILHCGFARAAIHVGAGFFTIRDSKVWQKMGTISLLSSSFSTNFYTQPCILRRKDSLVFAPKKVKDPFMEEAPEHFPHRAY